ncbi:UNVERIFIED_ORG: drug/metabolite transporter (DMT)-like permease [Leuconostoc holzapfelii]
MSIRFKAITLGIISAFFFSITFVVNEVMANAHGYWGYTAALRYLWMLPLMLIVNKLFGSNVRHVLGIIKRDMKSWFIWSQVCFVLFYVPLCWAVNYLPGWLISATWQLTIIFGVLTTPLVRVKTQQSGYVRLKIPTKAIPWMVIILVGVFLTVVSYITHLKHIAPLLFAIIAIMLAAVAYPLGNRQIMATTDGTVTASEKVLAMLICSYPTWLIIATLSYTQVGLPSAPQLLNTFIVALCSGVIATVLFFGATQLAVHDMKSLAAVEATQAMEVIFSVLLSLLFLGHALPTPAQLAGLCLMVFGIIMLSIRE